MKRERGEEGKRSSVFSRVVLGVSEGRGMERDEGEDGREGLTYGFVHVVHSEPLEISHEHLDSSRSIGPKDLPRFTVVRV